MKLNKAETGRTLHARLQEDGLGYVLIERIHHRESAFSKSGWDEDRIYISIEELDKLSHANPKDLPERIHHVQSI